MSSQQPSESYPIKKQQQQQYVPCNNFSSITGTDCYFIGWAPEKQLAKV